MQVPRIRQARAESRRAPQRVCIDPVRLGVWSVIMAGIPANWGSIIFFLVVVA
jgi:hypothetical protein